MLPREIPSCPLVECKRIANRPPSAPTTPRFGVCCVFTITASGSTVRENCTYLANPGFPAKYTQSTSVIYTVNKLQKGEARRGKLLYQGLEEF